MAKRPGASGIIALAVILGLLTAYFIYTYLRDVKRQARENWQPVVVAIADIKPRTTISREMVQLMETPPDMIAADAITDPNEVVGRISVSRIKAKEQLRASDIVQKGQAPSYSYQVPPGKRAMAIKAGEVEAAGQTVKAGDHVDILATFHDPVSRQETTQMIMQNVPVLWVNIGETDSANPGGAKSSMTLAVAPEDVERLTAADRAGALRIVLRPAQDNQIVQTTGVTVRDLGGGKSIEMVSQPQVKPQLTQNQTEPRATPVIISPPPSRARDREIEIYRGVTKQKETISPE